MPHRRVSMDHRVKPGGDDLKRPASTEKLFRAAAIAASLADPQCQTATLSLSRPAIAGRGDRTKCGGRGAGFNDCSDPTTKRRVRSPLHHAPRGPPPPLSRGRIQAIVLAMRLGTRGLLHALRKPVQHAPNNEGGRSAERRVRFLPCPAGPGARHASECCHPSALRARSPCGAPPRHSPRRTHPDIGSASVPRFLRSGACGRYPLPPVSVYRAPRRPVVVPVGR